MEKIYQDEWFNIYFRDFTKVSDSQIADSKFYKEFYKEFYLKYNNYSELPQEYIKEKEILSKEIFEMIKDYPIILSIGCGNGIIENNISKGIIDTQSLFAFEESPNNSRWLLNNDRVTFVDSSTIHNLKNIDVIYANNIDYVFNNDEYIDFLNYIKELKPKKLLLTDVIGFKESWVKRLIKLFLYSLGIRKKVQFWGYLRTIEEHKNLFKLSGFENIEIGHHSNGNIWIGVSI